jgi:hypothetical protein
MGNKPMKTILLSCVGILALAACGGPKAGEQSAEEVAVQMADLKMRPGQWEATSEIMSANAPGMPPETLRAMVGEKQTVSRCITPEQAAKPSANFLAGQGNSDCTYRDFSAGNGAMRGTMSCSVAGIGGETVMKMQGKYSPVAYDMDMDMDVAMAGGIKMTMKARTTGRRTGECT